MSGQQMETFTNPDGHRRVVAAVEKALGDDHRYVVADTDGLSERTYVQFQGEEATLTAARLVGDGVTTWELHGAVVADASDDTSLCAVSSRDRQAGSIDWRPAGDDISLERYMSCWEYVVDAWVNRRPAFAAIYPKSGRGGGTR